MTQTTRHELAALSAGVLFGAGLVVSGMTKPAKVLGFLDPFAAWDASLMFVMLGAIGVHFLAYRVIRGRTAPWFAEKFALPTRRDLDMKLLLGAAIFGIGWGLAGYCPGPALTSLVAGGTGALVFVATMLLGMLITAKLESASHTFSFTGGGTHVDKQAQEIILDVRTAAEFAAAHVPGATNIPVQELPARLAELGAKDTSIVIYCRSGARSAAAAALLKGAGFARVTDNGPMSSWPTR